MTTSRHYQNSTALWAARNPVFSSPILTRSLSDQKSRGTPNLDGKEPHPLDLKRLGATPTVRFVVFAGLGIAAAAETTFWCSWLWAKMKAQDGDKREDGA